MGKRKRSNSKSRSDIRRKMRKLEERLNKYKRRISFSSSASSDSAQDIPEPYYMEDETLPEQYQNDITLSEDELLPTCNEASSQSKQIEPLPPPLASPVPIPGTTAAEPEKGNESNTIPTEEAASLDPEILQMLGDDPADQKAYGESLHKDIAPRWSHIITNGLDKDVKQELLKNYLPPENCKSLRAPQLNLEVKAALADLSVKKDLYSQSKQNQLSSSLAAIGTALNTILSSKDTSPQLQQLVKPLSDAARLICDCHYRESLSRRFAIVNTLNKETRDLVKNSKIDEFLFGADLADQLKSHKAISKSGLEMKAFSAPRIPFRQPPTTSAQRGALNSRGATRAAAGEPRRNPPPRRPATTAPVRDRRHPTTSTAARSNYNSRQRLRRR